ncbi:ATP-binding protein [Roseibium sp.]|uniref:ATP-binding protein n=1 Tax=Roseibium sp. TaxID=1936156 RepID=UPI003A9868F9
MQKFTQHPEGLFNRIIGQRFWYTMKSRIMLLASCCVLVSTLIIGGLYYERIRTTTLDQAELKLATETRLTAQKFHSAYRSISQDLEIISLTPPLQGIIRSMSNGGIDPIDGSSTAEWRQRLETIFSAVLASRESYFQFRYIGAEDNGREIVRVDRTERGLVTVDANNLQQKGGEGYFQSGLAGRSGVAHFSDVTFNRERNKIDPRKIPTIRGTLPIDGPDGERFGMLVINVNYEKMLQAAFEEIGSENQVLVLNGLGDYMAQIPGSDGNEYELQMHSNYSKPVPAAVQFIMAHAPEEGFIQNPESVAYYIRNSGSFDGLSSSLTVILQVPGEVLFAQSTLIRNQVLVVGLVLILACMALSAYFARLVVAPLHNLANHVLRSEGSALLPWLPTKRADEIGDLARSLRHRTLALDESEARASAIVENVLDGLVLLDENGRIESFNPSCERMFGYTAEEMIGRNISVLMNSDIEAVLCDVLQEDMHPENKKVSEPTRELQAVRKNGDALPIEMTTSALVLNETSKLIGVIRDISQRKEVERVRNEFVATVSHELRTPLTSVRGSLILVHEFIPENVPATVLKMLAMAQKNTERLIFLVNDILDFERLEAGKMEFALAISDINEEVRRAVDLNQGYADGKGVTLEVKLQEGTAPVKIDSNRMQQVLANLISNACKFSPPGGIVTLETAIQNGRIRVSVIDRGCGIDESFASRIFSAFSQANGSSSREAGGTGLGLNITKRFVEGQNGEIGFDSVKDEGSRFWVEFPISGDRVRRAETLPPPMSGLLSCLHLEDDVDFSAILSAGLATCVTLTNEVRLSDAIARVKQEDFDVVIIDITLGDENGLDLIEALPNPKETLVIVLTATEDRVDNPYVDAVFIKSRTVAGELMTLLQDLIKRKMPPAVSDSDKSPL